MTIYINTELALIIHSELIFRYGGKEGIRDLGALDSALMRPQLGYYNDLFEEAAALMESLANNHPFMDGNKRVAFFITDTFLRMNGYFIDCSAIETYEYFMTLFENKKFEYKVLLEWIKSNTSEL